MPPSFIPSAFFGKSLPHDPSPRQHSATPRCKQEGPPPRPRPKRKPSAFENTIDDLTMKRLGRGTIYYGERASQSTTDPEEDDQIPPFRPDAVLVTGATGRTGQWIALGLVNQGFNVRVLSRSMERAEKLFGPSGSNVDIVEADVTADLTEAVEGCIAVVCAHGAPWWLPGGYQSVDAGGIRNLVAAVKKEPKVGRIVMIGGGTGARRRAKKEAEEALKESGVKYLAIRVEALNDLEGGLKKVEMGGTGRICRLDLAQVVCQALVYERSILELAKEDPSGGFDFPSLGFPVRNGEEVWVPEKRFWKKEFARITSQMEEAGE